MAESKNRMRKQLVILKHGQITLPKSILELFHLDEGDILELSVNNDGEIIITPINIILADQQGFWTKKWQVLEREADEDIQDGRIKSFENIYDLIRDLESDAD